MQTDLLYLPAILIVALLVFAIYHFRAKLEAIIAKLEGKSSAATSPVTVNIGTSPTPTPAPAPVAQPSPVAATSASLPTGIDTPDPTNGRVALTGLLAGNPYAKWRFAIAEVGNALTGAAHDDVLANVWYANGVAEISGFDPACLPVVTTKDLVTGAPVVRVDSTKPSIQNTLAFPPSVTVAAATAYLATRTALAPVLVK